MSDYKESDKIYGVSRYYKEKVTEDIEVLKLRKFI